MGVIWSQSAETDLRQIRDFISRDNPRAAIAVAAAIKAAGDSLGEFPLKGHPGEDGTREWVVPRLKNFLLIYDADVEAGTVIVLRGWHQSRNR